MVLVVAAATLAAYALSRVRLPGRDLLLYVLLLFCSVVSRTAAMVPLFLLVFELGLINTYLGVTLVLTGGLLPAAIFILKDFTDTTPTSYEESARVFGASPFQILRDVVVPLVRPGMAVIAVWTIVNGWGNFLIRWSPTASTPRAARPTCACCRPSPAVLGAGGGHVPVRAAPLRLPLLRRDQALMAEVVLSSLVKEFPGGVRAIDRLDLRIDDGEFFALLGLSGCGKTTLLRTIAELEAPTSGTIEIGGRDVTRVSPGGRDVAMVFQDYALYPHMTVTDNIAYPLKVKRVPKAERQRTATEAGASLQLEATMERRPGQLSGGQQQRVALARAIAYRPHVFLFDEPLSNLDARLRLEARSFLKRLQQELGTTTVRHPRPVRGPGPGRPHGRDGRRAGPAAGHAGRGVPAPGQPVRGRLHRLDPDEPAGGHRGRRRAAGRPLPPAGAGPQLSAGDKVVVGVRPEYAELAHDERPGAIAGRVTLLQSLGSAFLVSVDSDGVLAPVTVPEGRQPAVGDRAFLVPDPKRLLVYRADDGELVGAGQPA